MPNNAYRRRGIAGVPGRNLNSVRGSLDISGLYPVRMENGGLLPYGEGGGGIPTNFYDRLKGMEEALANSGYYAAPGGLDREGIMQSRDILSQLPGMEPTDYEALRKEDKEQARLNFYLKMAEHGFRAAGAQPREGESPISTLSRELAAPLAADTGAITSEFGKTRRAYEQLRKQEQRGLSQAALTYEQSRKAAEAEGKSERTKMALALMEEDTTSVGIKENLQELNDQGEWVPFVGFSSAWKYGEVPQYIKIVGGKKVPVDSDKIRVAPTASEGKGITEPGFKPVAFEVPIFGVNPKGERVITGVGRQYGELWTHIDKGATGGPRMVTGTDIFRPGTLGTERYTNADGTPLIFGQDVFGIDLNWKKGEAQDMWLRSELSEAEIKKLREISGFETLPLGQRVFRQRDVYKTDPSHTRDRIYISTSGQLIGSVQNKAEQALIESFFTSEKPADAIPTGGKPLGKTSKEFTLTREDGTQDSVSAVLWQKPDGSIVWRTVGDDPQDITKKWLEQEGYQSAKWESEARDSLYNYSLGPANEEFKNAAARLEQYDSTTREALVKQKLTRAQVLGWAESTNKAQYLRDILTTRASDLSQAVEGAPDESPDRRALFGSNYAQDPSVKMLAAPIDDTGGVYISRNAVDPYNRPADKNINIGRWATGALSSDDIHTMRQYADAINKNFVSIMGQELSFDGEQILAHSHLWKNFPDISGDLQKEQLTPAEFRRRFAKAEAEFNTAKGQYKPAVDIEIGSSNLANKVTTGMDALDDVQIMLANRDVGGAWFSDGDWMAEMRTATGLGELWESWTDHKGNDTLIPSEKWLAIADPKTEQDRLLRENVFAYFNDKGANSYSTGREISLNEFERAAVYLGAMNRAMSRVFELIDESRPSDRDVEIMLNGLFVQGGDTETKAAQLLLNLGKKYTDLITNNMKANQHTALYSPELLFRVGQVGKAFSREAIYGRTAGPRDARSEAVRRSYNKWGIALNTVAKRASERIIPGHQGLSMSPITGVVNTDFYTSIKDAIQTQAQALFPNVSPQEAFDKFIEAGHYIKRFGSVFDVPSQQTVAPGVTYLGGDRFRIE